MRRVSFVTHLASPILKSARCTTLITKQRPANSLGSRSTALIEEDNASGAKIFLASNRSSAFNPVSGTPALPLMEPLDRSFDNPGHALDRTEPAAKNDNHRILFEKRSRDENNPTPATEPVDRTEAVIFKRPRQRGGNA